MSKCYCDICCSEYSVSEFRRLACGHCLCTHCIDRIQRAVCPHCRAPIQEGDPQPIYLNIVGAKPLASIVAEGIGRMDGNSKLVSARNAQRKLEQVAAAQKAADARAMEALLAAIADFKERIVPVFAAVKSQETQLEGLDELKAQAERATRLGGEVTILRAEGVTLRQEIRDAKAQRDAAVEREEQKTAQILVLQRKLDAAEGEARTEIRRLKGFLERNADDRTALRSKIHVLQQEKDVLGRQVEDLTAENRAVRARASDYSDDLEIEEEVFASEYSQSSPVSSHPTLTHRSSVPQTPNPPVPAFDFEGMPRPGFGSDWQLNRGTKRKEREIPPGFPIALDRGRTTIAVQLGPKHSRRVKVR